MDQSRYRDKSYLVTYELTTDLFETFGLKVDDIVPIRSVFMLYTDKGVKVLKKVNYSFDELEFIQNVLEHASKNGYQFVVPFMRNINGSYFEKRPDGIYVVLDLVEGREADYQNPIDLIAISKALCSYHKATKGLNYILAKRNNLFNWIPTFERRALDLLKFKEIAALHEIKTGFDMVFIDYIERYYEDALQSISLLKNSSYNKLCGKTEEEKNICHHDLAYHNIIIDSENNIFFVDFDYCMMDLRIHDIGNFIVKAIKNSGWDIEKASTIISSYCSRDELSSDELNVLYDFLVFPQDFYDISRSYYMKTKKWDEDDFLTKLEIKAGYYNDRKVFLNQFLQKVKEGNF